MASRFTETQRRAIQDLLGLPSRLTADAVPAKLSIPIKDVRRALGLAEPPHCSLLAEDRWLAGGSVLRWLAGGLGKGSLHPGDVDLFFPSADALNETARSLIAAGYTFRCFRSFQVICQLCGGPGELVEPGGKDRAARIRCPSCGEFGGADAHTLTAGRLLRLTPELISRSGMLALEILSPQGEMFHLSALGIRPDSLRGAPGMRLQRDPVRLGSPGAVLRAARLDRSPDRPGAHGEAGADRRLLPANAEVQAPGLPALSHDLWLGCLPRAPLEDGPGSWGRNRACRS